MILDITATVEGRRATAAMVEACADELSIPLTVGGGVKSLADMERLLTAGADKVAVNSAAVRDPAMLSACAEQFGRQCVVLAIDARRHGIPADALQHEETDDDQRMVEALEEFYAAAQDAPSNRSLDELSRDD